jgi:hypothetical protein
MLLQSTQKYEVRSTARLLKHEFLANVTPLILFENLERLGAVTWLDASSSKDNSGTWSYVLIRTNHARENQANEHVSSVNGKLADSMHKFTARQSPRSLGASEKLNDVSDGGPPFRGGWVGFVGYEALSPQLEFKNSTSPKRLSFARHDVVLAYNIRRGYGGWQQARVLRHLAVVSSARRMQKLRFD